MKTSTSTLFLSLFAFFLLIPTILPAQGECSITVASLSGTASTTRGGLSTGATLSKGDTIYVGAGSLLELKIGDDAISRIAEQSKVYIDASYCPDATTHAVRLKVVSGWLWAKGSPGVEKFQITSEHFIALVGTSTIAVRAHYLDTNFSLTRGRQRIETRDWYDTVEVESYSFPFVGHTSMIYALEGEPFLVPWGGEGRIFHTGMQSTFGFDPNHIPSDPTAIERSGLLFTKEGTYSKGS